MSTGLTNREIVLSHYERAWNDLASVTGRPVKIAGMILHRLRDGKIVEDHAVRDTLGLLTQLGVIRLNGG